MTISIIDMSEPVTAASLDHFWNLGIRSIGRYFDRMNPNDEKNFTPAEGRLFLDRGMRMFPIYEFNGQPSGAQDGQLDGRWSAECMASIGAPTDGSVWIAATVDWDAPVSAMPGILSYFAAFAAAVKPKYSVAAYASGAVNAGLWQSKLIVWRWLTMSDGYRGTAEALATGAYDMRQALDIEIAGIDVDPDSCHVASYLPGFIPFATVQPPPQATGWIRNPIPS